MHLRETLVQAGERNVGRAHLIILQVNFSRQNSGKISAKNSSLYVPWKGREKDMSKVPLFSCFIRFRNFVYSLLLFPGGHSSSPNTISERCATSSVTERFINASQACRQSTANNSQPRRGGGWEGLSRYSLCAVVLFLLLLFSEGGGVGDSWVCGMKGLLACSGHGLSRQ